MKRGFARLLLPGLIVGSVAFTPITARAGEIAVNFQQGLVDVNVQNVLNNLNNVVVVDVSNVNILNGVEIDILRNGVVQVLSNNSDFLNNWNVLNDALRDARFLHHNQVVIGILSGTIPVILVDKRNKLGLTR
jgi:hypothetical protein